jgi:hypothetical protein
MTTCDTCCGTGSWANTPKPGDPDNNLVLTATAAYGGIDVSFTYPTLNPEAVAYVNLYRGTSDVFDQAVRLVVLSGNFYYDKSPNDFPTEYFYWVEIVSINGTTLAAVGPASAIARPLIADLIAILSGQINRGVLAADLNTELAKITTLENGLTSEAAFRESSTNAAAAAFTGLQAAFDDTAALVLQETQARSTADSALASQVNTVQSAWGNQLATVQTTMQTEVDTVAGIVTEIGARYTVKVDVNGLVGGFGVYNDGTEIEAGFDVDRFWVGKSGALIKPFIIDAGVTYINDAAINKLVFSKLRDESGSVIIEDGRIKAKYIQADETSIIDGSITNAKIADAAINNAKIQNAAITAAKIQDAAITTAKIADAQITNLKVVDAAIDTLKLAGQSVTTGVFAQTAYYGSSFYVNVNVAAQVLILATVPKNFGGYPQYSTVKVNDVVVASPVVTPIITGYSGDQANPQYDYVVTPAFGFINVGAGTFVVTASNCLVAVLVLRR